MAHTHLRAGLARLYARTRMYMTRAGVPTRTHARTHRPIWNTYCFSTTTMVSRTHLSVTLHALCLSCDELKLLSGVAFWRISNVDEVCGWCELMYSIHSFIPYSVLRQVYSLFQSEFSTERDLVIRICFQYLVVSLRSSSSCLRLLPRLSITSVPPPTFRLVTCFRRQLLRKIWPIQLAFFLYTVM